MSNATADDPFSRTEDGDDDTDAAPLLIILGAVAAAWCCAMAISTKGCRDFHHNNRYASDDPVWMPTTLRDHRLALQLQRQEAESARAEAREHRLRAEEARKAWVEKILDKQDLVVFDTRNLDLHQSCAICLVDFTVNSVALQGAHCAHVFHKQCIGGALQRTRDCPICRQVFLAEDVIDEKCEDQGDDAIVSSDGSHTAQDAVSEPPIISSVDASTTLPRPVVLGDSDS